jgi:hypothetical protein
VAGLASNLVFLLALLLFLSVESGGAVDRLASIARDRPQITAALGHFAWGTRQYLLVTTVFGLIVAVLDSVALALLGVPLAVTWGLLSFITNYIPNVGFVIGVIPPAVLALLQGGPTLALVVVLVYCGINFRWCSGPGCWARSARSWPSRLTHRSGPCRREYRGDAAGPVRRGPADGRGRAVRERRVITVVFLVSWADTWPCPVPSA